MFNILFQQINVGWLLNYELEFMDKQLFCCICDRQYSEVNIPRLFAACGHTYCENCIRNLMGLNKQKEVRIICPQDHIEMKFADKDINHFPKNISLIKLMESLKGPGRRSSKGSRQQSAFSDHEGSFQQTDPLQPPSPTPTPSSLRQSLNQPPPALNLKSKSVVSQDTLNEQQICLIHQRPLQVVCIQHRTVICPSCAIFGEHKGHDFKSIKEMEKDKMVREQRILRIIDRKEEIVKRADRREEQAARVEAKKDKMLAEVRGRFIRMYELLRFAEKKSVDRLGKFFHGIEDRFKTASNILQQPLKLYALWEERAMKEVDSFEKGTNLREQLEYLGYEGDLDFDVLDEGNRILQTLEEAIKDSKKSFDQTIDGIEVVFNEETEKCINNYVNFKDPKDETCQTPLKNKNSIRESSGKMQEFEPGIREQTARDSVIRQAGAREKRISVLQPPNLEHNDQMLLQTERPKGSLLSRTKSNEFNRFIQDKKLTLNLQQINSTFSDMKQSQLSSPNAMQYNQSFKFQTQKPQISNLKGTLSPRSKQASNFNYFEQTKRKPKIKLSDKYDKVLDSIIQDAVELADFTGAELGDNTTLQILDVVKGKKVKSLKLIRNKLTDGILDEMWPYLANLQVLNLSQNYFTERVLESFISNMSKVPQLRSLILSQNKINARNVKSRVEELKRFDITVSL